MALVESALRVTSNPSNLGEPITTIILTYNFEQYTNKFLKPIFYQPSPLTAYLCR